MGRAASSSAPVRRMEGCFSPGRRREYDAPGAQPRDAWETNAPLAPSRGGTGSFASQESLQETWDLLGPALIRPTSYVFFRSVCLTIEHMIRPLRDGWILSLLFTRQGRLGTDLRADMHVQVVR